MKRYPDCQNEGCSDCAACSLSNYGRDCHNNPCNQLAYLRAKAGLTQAQLAQKTGKHVMYISKLERGDRQISGISLETAIAIADALGVDDLRELL